MNEADGDKEPLTAALLTRLLRKCIAEGTPEARAQGQLRMPGAPDTALDALADCFPALVRGRDRGEDTKRTAWINLHPVTDGAVPRGGYRLGPAGTDQIDIFRLRRFFQRSTSAGVAGRSMPAAVAAVDHSSQDALIPRRAGRAQRSPDRPGRGGRGLRTRHFQCLQPDGKSWQENPATVAIAALLREHPAREDQTPGQPPGAAPTGESRTRRSGMMGACTASN